MLELFFLFVQRKILSFDFAQKIITHILPTKEQGATNKQNVALCAKGLQTYSTKQVTTFSTMGIHKLKNDKKLFCLSYHSRAKASDSLHNQPPFITNKRHHMHKKDSKATTAHQTVKKPSKAEKQTLLTWIQPGLAGLMDGSVSTLAPIFAAAFATGDTHQTFLIGLSASIGAGLSMGFTEAAHDDGKLSGRGSPFKRGLASGVMTALGGLGHTLPYLIHSFYIATIIAFIIVFFELWIIVWIQNKFMATPFWRASLQVIIGGALVFATGILIGSI